MYKAPEGGICPCCRPSITADQTGNVYVMFRNELKGARDMYIAHSKDGGETFKPAQKLGMGTWTLKACPMDEGAVAINAAGKVGTTWRRDKTILYAEPGVIERKIGEGRASNLVKTSKGNYIAWQQGTKIVVQSPNKLGSEIMGTGIYPRLTALANDKVLCVWEKDEMIYSKLLQ